MALQIAPSGSTFGAIPGSQAIGSRLYGPQYQGVMGLMAGPDPSSGMQSASWEQGYNQQGLANQHQQDMWGKQNKLYDSLLSNLNGMNGNMNYSSQQGGYVPPPQYASTGGIWNQQQINNQANSQRAQLNAQAANQMRHYATNAAQRGFSPLSPMTAFMEQVGSQRANIGAMNNETNLNWNAAQGNREAQQRGEGINAGLYGSYTSALARQRDQSLQAQNMGFQQNMDKYQLLAGLLRGMT